MVWAMHLHYNIVSIVLSKFKAIIIFTDQVPASVSVVNDTTISLQWRTPTLIEQQNLTAYQVSVESECFNDIQEGQLQNFNILANSSLHITVGSLGKFII